MLNAWKAMIPAEVYDNLVQYGSGAYIPWLVEQAPRLGKIPFCVDATASYWARIITHGVYPLETREEAGRRHLSECREESCDWCDEERLFQ